MHAYFMQEAMLAQKLVPNECLRAHTGKKEGVQYSLPFQASFLMSSGSFPDEYSKIVVGATKRFRGQAQELESAIGMLFLGHMFGWKVLYLTHSKATIRKYEKILGISVRETFPEVGPEAERSMGFRLAQKFSNFWKLVSGSEPEYKRTSEITKGT